MIVLGIDSSLTGTGISLQSGRKHYKTLALRKGKTLRDAERLNYIYRQVLSTLRDATPSLAVIEGYSFGSRFSRSHALGEVGGVIRLALFKTSTPYLVVPPKSLKLYVSGDAKADKKKIVRCVKAQTEKMRPAVTIKDDNEADAYALASLGVRLFTFKHGEILTTGERMGIQGAQLFPFSHKDSLFRFPLFREVKIA